MVLVHTIILCLIGFSFLYYGVSCLSSRFMITEFDRFGLSESQRKITGAAQILGGLGILAGFLFNPLQVVALTGLALLMFMGWIIRLQTRDNFKAALPAFLLFTVCLYLIHYILNIK
ncbi:DoxX family protein [Dokdonia sp. Hel_I_53]|uniref:DoxX family protein n=1 Tax=Dokdonia sp. Hel_I_53 TaxID=1566287 RepID=UPI00119B904E|nr:DoxX family protein [Dokdonia sp. Hel_I_53]TVZ51438.1 DoxX-like protein [Dokdonia sp. Hel_I_53]